MPLGDVSEVEYMLILCMDEFDGGMRCMIHRPEIRERFINVAQQKKLRMHEIALIIEWMYIQDPIVLRGVDDASKNSSLSIVIGKFLLRLNAEYEKDFVEVAGHLVSKCRCVLSYLNSNLNRSNDLNSNMNSCLKTNNDMNPNVNSNLKRRNDLNSNMNSNLKTINDMNSNLKTRPGMKRPCDVLIINAPENSRLHKKMNIENIELVSTRDPHVSSQVKNLKFEGFDEYSNVKPRHLKTTLCKTTPTKGSLSMKDNETSILKSNIEITSTVEPPAVTSPANIEMDQKIDLNLKLLVTEKENIEIAEPEDIEMHRKSDRIPITRILSMYCGHCGEQKHEKPEDCILYNRSVICDNCKTEGHLKRACYTILAETFRREFPDLTHRLNFDEAREKMISEICVRCVCKQHENPADCPLRFQNVFCKACKCCGHRVECCLVELTKRRIDFGTFDFRSLVGKRINLKLESLKAICVRCHDYCTDRPSTCSILQMVRRYREFGDESNFNFKFQCQLGQVLCLQCGAFKTSHRQHSCDKASRTCPCERHHHSACPTLWISAFCGNYLATCDLFIESIRQRKMPPCNYLIELAKCPSRGPCEVHHKFCDNRYRCKAICLLDQPWIVCGSIPCYGESFCSHAKNYCITCGSTSHLFQKCEFEPDTSNVVEFHSLSHWLDLFYATLENGFCCKCGNQIQDGCVHYCSELNANSCKICLSVNHASELCENHLFECFRTDPMKTCEEWREKVKSPNLLGLIAESPITSTSLNGQFNLSRHRLSPESNRKSLIKNRCDLDNHVNTS